MQSRIVRRGAVALLGVALGGVAACGSEGTGGGSAGTGGSSAAAGSGGTAGAAPNCNTPFGECIDCLDTRCTVAYTQCEYDTAECGPERMKFATCLAQCQAAPADCASAFTAAGGPKATALYECAKTTCASAPGTCQKP